MSLPSPANRKVLVTGASGFIGSRLCVRLRDDGAEVHAVARTRRRTDPDGLHWWYGDLAEEETFPAVLKAVRPDTVFHLASHVEGGRDVELVMPTFRSNLLATIHLLTAAVETPCRRVILCGSLEEPAAGEPYAVPSSPYAAAKWASTAYARMFHALYGLPVVIMRVFMVYGPGQWNLRKLVPYVTLSLLRGEAPKLTGGERQVDWIYVDDVVDAFIAAAAAAEGIEGATVDVGSGKLETVRNVAGRIADLIDPGLQPSYGALPDRPFEQVRRANPRLSGSVIDWTPKVSLEDGLRETVNWYREHRVALVEETEDKSGKPAGRWS